MPSTDPFLIPEIGFERCTSSRQSSVAASPRRWCSSRVMSGTSIDGLAPGRRAVTMAERGVTVAVGWERGSTEPSATAAGPCPETVTIAGLRSSLAGAGGVSGFVPLRPIAGTSSRTGFRFLGGRL